METTSTQVSFTTLTASPGKLLTDGSTVASVVSLPPGADPSLWYEIDEDTPQTSEEPSQELPYADTERAIVQTIARLATEYNAIAELGSMDITIPGLLALAESKGVPEAELVKVKSDIAMLVLDLMAKAGGTWAECWEGLKSRFAGYLG